MGILYNYNKIKDFVVGGRSARRKIVTIGNSNMFYANFGWGKGLEKALFEIVGQWATGIVSFGGNADNQGYLWSKSSFPNDLPVEAPAPNAAILDLWPGPSGHNLKPFNYGHITSSFTASNVGISLPNNSFIPCQNNLSILIGSCFDPAGGAGNFTPQARTDSGLGPNLNGVLKSVAGIDYELFDEEWQIPANVNRAGRTFEGGILRSTGTPVAINGRVFINTCRLVDRDRLNGFSTTNIWSVGGGPGTARTCAADLRVIGATSGLLSLSQKFLWGMSQARVLYIIGLRLNDRNETNPSIDTGITPGNSKAAYKENVNDILNSLTNNWAGGALEIGFLLDFEHDSTPTRSTQENEFYDALKEISDARPNVAVCDINQLYPYSVFNANGWFDGLGPDHLTQAGYIATNLIKVRALLGLDSGVTKYHQISGSL